MSKEEKEVIERLDYFEPDDLVECAMYRDCVEKIKNLIDKQKKKKIEELKKELYQEDKEEPTERTEEMVNMRWVNHNYISKDKIRATINDLKNMEDKTTNKQNKIEFNYAKAVLQELLEEEN